MVLPTGKRPLEILLAPEAEQDLRDIYTYVADHAGQEQGHTILGRLEADILAGNLAPARQHPPRT